MPLPRASATCPSCTTHPWTRMRRDRAAALRSTCQPAGCAPCDTLMPGRASSAQRGKRMPSWPSTRPHNTGDPASQPHGWRVSTWAALHCPLSTRVQLVTNRRRGRRGGRRARRVMVPEQELRTTPPLPRCGARDPARRSAVTGPRRRGPAETGCRPSRHPVGARKRARSRLSHRPAVSLGRLPFLDGLARQRQRRTFAVELLRSPRPPPSRRKYAGQSGRFAS